MWMGSIYVKREMMMDDDGSDDVRCGATHIPKCHVEADAMRLRRDKDSS
jgi:hypothetical protein